MINITDNYGQAHAIDLDNLGNQAFCMDCMDLMKALPDKCFELAIVDVPYGIKEAGERSTRIHKTEKWKNAKATNYAIKSWDNKPPGKEYFRELKRVSVNQIIWGANHFIENIPKANSSCWIFWDKKNGDNDFADGELAYTSFKRAVRKFEWLWAGFQKQKPEIRIHPTQKPTALYDYLLANYAHKGDRILDTHLGSGSSRIAAWQAGYNFLGTEIDKDYYEQGCKRYESYACQLKLI